jgi:hypothetical protein
MKPDIRWMLLPSVAGLATLACAFSTPSGLVSPGPTGPPTVETTLPRATPNSLEPAAGICTQAEGDEAVMRLEPGIPDPRCMIVRGDQRLRVLNHTGGDVAIAIGPFSLPLPANGETVIGPPIGSYLLPGVHVLQVDPCCGGELWLKEE